MKTVSRVLITASIFSMLAAPQVFAAGVEELQDAGGGAPAHMLIYEAAEQAAEEKYAVIIPSTDSKQEKKDVDATAEETQETAVDNKAEEKTPQKAE